MREPTQRGDEGLSKKGDMINWLLLKQGAS